jgi:hypothetical protein
MSSARWYAALCLGLSAAAGGIYLAQILLFHDTRDTAFYLLQDLAFLPLQLLLVTVLVNAWLDRREKRALMQKMNMVIGAFFSEIGGELLRRCVAFDGRADEVCRELLFQAGCTDADLARLGGVLKAHGPDIACDRGDLAGLERLLGERHAFLLGLLGNENLLEHRSFTDLLWAVTHLMEELSFREDLGALPPADRDHLANDIRRVYGLLAVEWISYARHLRSDYPYMFSLVVRTNPFDPRARAEISGRTVGK